jgi:hypothetical protein
LRGHVFHPRYSPVKKIQLPAAFEQEIFFFMWESATSWQIWFMLNCKTTWRRSRHIGMAIYLHCTKPMGLISNNNKSLLLQQTRTNRIKIRNILWLRPRKLEKLICEEILGADCICILLLRLTLFIAEVLPSYQNELFYCLADVTRTVWPQMKGCTL